jgi:hypothetical protein
MINNLLRIAVTTLTVFVTWKGCEAALEWWKDKEPQKK